MSCISSSAANALDWVQTLEHLQGIRYLERNPINTIHKRCALKLHVPVLLAVLLAATEEAVVATAAVAAVHTALGPIRHARCRHCRTSPSTEHRVHLLAQTMCTIPVHQRYRVCQNRRRNRRKKCSAQVHTSPSWLSWPQAFPPQPPPPLPPPPPSHPLAPPAVLQPSCRGPAWLVQLPWLPDHTHHNSIKRRIST